MSEREYRTLSTPKRADDAAPAQKTINFYERELYCLSNFSSFDAVWLHGTVPTTEYEYHLIKFEDTGPVGQAVTSLILKAKSSHDAYKVAEKYRSVRRDDWDSIAENGRPVKVNVMKRILHSKANRHEYVARKLEESGDAVLSERSWRDDFWGTGPKGDGQDWMGKLWMEVRKERRERAADARLVPNRPEVVAGLVKPRRVTPMMEGAGTAYDNGGDVDE